MLRMTIQSVARYEQYREDDNRKKAGPWRREGIGALDQGHAVRCRLDKGHRILVQAIPSRAS